MINDLFAIQNRLGANISLDFKRYLYRQINWDNRLIIIRGARGTGKSTMLLQYFLEKYNDLQKCLYISADNPIVLKNGIYTIANEYFKYYGDCILVDEIHKQEDWSTEIKALYDAYPDKKFIVSGSSTLNILMEKGDLSRRAIIYSLAPLSLREFLNLKYSLTIQEFTLINILEGHLDIIKQIQSDCPTVLKDFRQYLQYGSYPFYINHSQDEYHNLLLNVLDKVVYEDISTIKSIRALSSLKLKKLLGYIATSTIPLFNIESLRRALDVSKDTLYEYFNLLEKAEILNIIRTSSNKPHIFKNSKILFKSPNLYYAIAQEFWKNDPNQGNIRESFFASQLMQKWPLTASLQTDFSTVINRQSYEFEVGGKSKKRKPVGDNSKLYIFKDGIESGFGDVVPLYLIGFLY